jgi:regulator of cell morphogenesis and NO signaling
MTATPVMTIREIVANDYRTAAVFERHGLDFCCGGCKTIEESCREHGIDSGTLLRELDDVLTASAAAAPAYNKWDAVTLIDYIVSVHHGYVRDAIPRLVQHTQKIAEVHGARRTELAHVARLVGRVAAEMHAHMEKEEQVLFPYIREVEEAGHAGRPAPPAPFGTVRNPIRAMESEHEFVGDAMAEIRQLTDGYRPPEGACATYELCLRELAGFERDLHAHVHLENNVLFPKAVALEGARS